MWRQLCVLFWLINLLAIVPKNISAQIVINEFSPAPATGTEWIELLNTGTTSASLAGWSLEDELTTPSVLITFPATASMSAGEYRLVEINNKLNNSGDGIKLFNAAHVLQDSVSFASSSAGLSYGRIPTGIGDWQLLQTPSSGSANVANPTPALTPTPTATPAPTPTPSPSASPANELTFLPPQLSEIMACPPTSTTEWVEFFNPNAEPLTLSSWKIVDAGNHSRIFSLTIPAQGYASISIEPAMLNNTGDQIQLLTSTGTIVDQFQYASCQSGLSWSFINGDWQEGDPTKNRANDVFDEATETIAGSTSILENLKNSVAANSSTSASSNWKTQKILGAFLTPLQLHASESSTQKSPLSQLNNEVAPVPLQQSPKHKKPPLFFILAVFGWNLIVFLSQLPSAWRWYTDYRAEQNARADPFFLA